MESSSLRRVSTRPFMSAISRVCCPPSSSARESEARRSVTDRQGFVRVGLGSVFAMVFLLRR